MSSQVLYDSPTEATVVTPVTFVNSTSVPTDPSAISCVTTDPAGTITTYTYPSSSNLTRTATGIYSLTITGITVPGLYMFTWVGSGNGVQQVTPGTFRLVPLSNVGYGMQYWYTGLEELKSRLGLDPEGKNYHAFDYEMQLSIHTVANLINRHCGRHFYRLSETRTYMPESIWELGIDDVCPSTAAQTVVNLDYDGDGVFETAWGNPAAPVGSGSFYALKLGVNGEDNYNPNAAGGVARPYRQLQAMMIPGAVASNGAWLPFVWPYSHLNRVQVVTTWGWDYIPPEVSMASLMLCQEMYLSKDTPWGMAGSAATGMQRVEGNPWICDLLSSYVNGKRKWGVLWTGTRPKRISPVLTGAQWPTWEGHATARTVASLPRDVSTSAMTATTRTTCARASARP